MRFESLEKTINKLDNDIEALRRVKQYLSNKDEINEISDLLNKERQVYADELYIGDAVAYNESLEILKQLFNKELGKDEQVKLLEDIKEIHGRKSPNVSKKSHGLNAWLKFLDIQCEWIENPNSDWSTLIIKGFIPRNNN
ncbi:MULTISPECIES: hypothetical protein [Clostridium]|jgi:hypothetical protein|uniref:Uncharacterized protein n=3 Tax=Clostridium TaxID=1485 RepID=A0A0B5Q8G1_CLOBE|nr:MULTISPECIES: hypothetical protein [Clostridium]ABR33930.1 conserved hypothetical protein [Clostridium beijerinckii NCIMB 8052]AIU01207.1 hypothetical protein Cbs_1758 [Clostridium beijerinckii ATCC 35702]AJG98499.1 hypothetical protein LF65_01899 [Clostridium beijerinckii]ALB47044.1 hypothetical protein X276_18255 [Clostridium beijerinckii NRRL B-598]AQS04376.1 hypothetical protein CLBIJ_17950 [Clostridium beijerinckii]